MSSGATGPNFNIRSMFPNAASGPTPAPIVVDIAELLASHGGIQTKEAEDRSVLKVLLHETRDTLRPAMFTWASAGFPAIYVIQQFTLTPPAVCSDGVVRGINDYVCYLLGQDMGKTIATIQSLCMGVVISYSFSGNTLRIHVSKS